TVAAEDRVCIVCPVETHVAFEVLKPATDAEVDIIGELHVNIDTVPLGIVSCNVTTACTGNVLSHTQARIEGSSFVDLLCENEGKPFLMELCLLSKISGIKGTVVNTIATKV